MSLIWAAPARQLVRFTPGGYSHLPMSHPTEIKLRRKSGILDVAFDDGQRFSLSAEYLRVHSPSAEVMGHGPGQRVLQSGKRKVSISNLEPVGNYGL